MSRNVPEGGSVEAERIKVLLVDDDQGDFEMTRAMISKIETREIDLEWVSTYEEGIDALEEDEHDVYLIDYYLEDRTGMDLLREAERRSLHAPLIMLTGRGNREVDLEAMRAGAADYLVKGRIDPELLERSIRYALERFRAERALRESEARHRGIFDHLPIGLYRSSPDGELIDANPALVRILGYPDRDALAGRYAPSFYVNPEDRERFWELLETDGVARGFESWIERADGREARVRNTARIHRNRDGSVAYVEGALEDVTAAHRARDAESGRERFHAVYEEGAIGIALVDLEGIVMEVNPAFRRGFGYSAGKVEGRALADLAYAEERPALAKALGSVAAGERERDRGDRRWTTGDGTPVRARTTTSLIRNAEGEPDHLLVLFENLSDTG
ncbi:MAG: PAS domain S-box protein [Gemmatimonadetes bacterium]|nr:PAS domain S-box protein [Gemmatimonadota bacterium]NIU33708.1 PAS domain S-box protein [Gemmatimonadota bacterium]NIU37951.1 PAS domain S-box protein [Gemmatimonadota bacterium]NIV84891.1 PAS domain S-box protein [Gemmatimonadota bacterium]NIW66789.1 PAS domain S-box protein [Gemmatimonadota bacterium]